MMTASSSAKMTSKTALTYVLTECSLPEDVREKLTAMVAALDKKSASRSATPTKAQREGVALRKQILVMLADAGKALPIEDVATALGVTSGKASAHLTILKRDGKVVRTEGPKRKAYFAITPGVDPEQEVDA